MGLRVHVSPPLTLAILVKFVPSTPYTLIPYTLIPYTLIPTSSNQPLIPDPMGLVIAKAFLLVLLVFAEASFEPVRL